jgi:hypothetical protein
MSNGEQVEPTGTIVAKKPREFLRFMIATYVATTDSGPVTVTIPEVVSDLECIEIEAFFKLIIRRMRRNRAATIPAVRSNEQR